MLVVENALAGFLIEDGWRWLNNWRERASIKYFSGKVMVLKKREVLFVEGYKSGVFV